MLSRASRRPDRRAGDSLGRSFRSGCDQLDEVVDHPFANPQIVARLKDVEEATWSPDGETIAFTRGFRIWLMNSDGTHVRPLTPQPRSSAQTGVVPIRSCSWGRKPTRIRRGRPTGTR